MDVILLENKRNLGTLGEKVSVKPGYGRNYLIPQGIAVAATKKNIADFESRRHELEKHAAAVLSTAQTRAEKLNGLTVEITARASDDGKLYGSVGTREIADAISQANAEVEKSEVLLSKGAFRFVGEYDVNIQLHNDVLVTVKVNIVPEQ